ncbi:hypothetical protein [Streptomyces sp. NPDC002082]|uniref:hypothetical protein n=1 Tax=Streptomyces sp. NPDC002082 TaxID=3154772 RepID=UPI00332A52AA
MFKILSTRRIVLASASVALLGGGIALPATAMAAPTAVPQHAVSVLQGDSADGIGTGGDATAGNTTVGGTSQGGNADSSVGSCKGKCTIYTGTATGGNSSADAVNTGDATAVGGEGSGQGGNLNKVNKNTVKNQLKKDLKAKLGN